MGHCLQTFIYTLFYMYEKVQYISTDNFVIDMNTTLGFVDDY